MSSARNKRYWRKLIALIFVTLLLCSCSNQSNNPNRDFAQEYEEYGGEMLVLGVVNDTDLTEDGVVYLNSIDDNLNIQFANLTESNSEYILKVSLDYAEIGYTLNGEYRTEYIFSANAGERLVFPIKLSEEIPFDTSHILTVAILTAPNKHAYSIDLMSNSYGVVLSYELSNKALERKIVANTEPEEPLDYLSLTYQGIMLNTDFEAVSDKSVKFPPKYIKTAPNDTVSLAYRIGNYENSEDVLAVVLVDWKQQSINGKSVLHTYNKSGYISYGVLDFTAPAQAGEYEVVAFVVDNPYQLKDFNTFHIHDTAYRFTLIVEP